MLSPSFIWLIVFFLQEFPCRLLFRVYPWWLVQVLFFVTTMKRKCPSCFKSAWQAHARQQRRSVRAGQQVEEKVFHSGAADCFSIVATTSCSVKFACSLYLTSHFRVDYT